MAITKIKSAYSQFLLPQFEHVNASSVAEAVSLMGKYKNARVVAGFSILQREMKHRVTGYEALINLKTIPNMDYIKEEGGMLKIGALATLTNIEKSPVVNGKYIALAQAARAVAGPRQRDVGTIGGNLCQAPQCWFFQAPEVTCLRKDPASPCYAVAGDNRYHSIFGGVGGCFAVCPGDTPVALVALSARVVTNKRTLDADKFLASGTIGASGTVLAYDEIVTEIQVPQPAPDAKSSYIKFALRRAIDFPVVSCAAVTGANPRIVLGAVYGTPYRATSAEAAITGKTISDAVADAAGTAAGDKAVPLTSGHGNRYKLQIARTLVKRAILAAK